MQQDVLNKQQIDNRINTKLVQKQSNYKRYGSEEEDTIFRDFSYGSIGEENKSTHRKSDPIFITKSRKTSSNEDKLSNESIGLEDFKILKFISKGTFGSVFLAYLP